MKTNFTRREFIAGAALVTGAAAIGHTTDAFALAVDTPPTVGEIMDTFIAQVSNAPFPNTVDTLKAGNRELKVTGVVTTMFATIEVIRKAIAQKANFIIAHEPTFYNHADDTQWLANDDVFQYKKKLLDDNGIAVWRNHDYIHSIRPDGVRKGVEEALGWQKYQVADQLFYQLPAEQSLNTIITHCKKQLGIQMVRYVGDLQQNCRKVVLMVGAAGGQRQISAVAKYKPDVLICGEISEWETAEYVRDARTKGDQLSLVVLGHIPSEQPGSAFMAAWLKQHFRGLPVTEINPGNSLSFV
ncbi:Nif3-like dinuclear metal center hexameric protein [Mucilaginibacter sp. RS28]|uniref:Nif3-like dinuclear metal center hexameric protein n=1 Tax=Mucilaginibacter straminoryzae TaxID=2932774 RepID=A0A9X1X6E3_9SPHI|nr:Nif3-like dinuclear metal center hexameric protein [Mucilaginibacter straminoryzae]MCJ8211416.1 Nif3-like dinuclear metal center hexameric protein [Mucilaginibacter straminoryzae]